MEPDEWPDNSPGAAQRDLSGSWAAGDRAPWEDEDEPQGDALAEFDADYRDAAARDGLPGAGAPCGRQRGGDRFGALAGDRIPAGPPGLIPATETALEANAVFERDFGPQGVAELRKAVAQGVTQLRRWLRRAARTLAELLESSAAVQLDSAQARDLLSGGGMGEALLEEAVLFSPNTEARARAAALIGDLLWITAPHHCWTGSEGRLVEALGGTLGVLRNTAAAPPGSPQQRYAFHLAETLARSRAPGALVGGVPQHAVRMTEHLLRANAAPPPHGPDTGDAHLAAVLHYSVEAAAVAALTPGEDALRNEVALGEAAGNLLAAIGEGVEAAATPAQVSTGQLALRAARLLGEDREEVARAVGRAACSALDTAADRYISQRSTLVGRELRCYLAALLRIASPEEDRLTGHRDTPCLALLQPVVNHIVSWLRCGDSFVRLFAVRFLGSLFERTVSARRDCPVALDRLMGQFEDELPLIRTQMLHWVRRITRQDTLPGDLRERMLVQAAERLAKDSDAGVTSAAVETAAALLTREPSRPHAGLARAAAARVSRDGRVSVLRAAFAKLPEVYAACAASAQSTGRQLPPGAARLADALLCAARSSSAAVVDHLLVAGLLPAPEGGAEGAYLAEADGVPEEGPLRRLVHLWLAVGAAARAGLADVLARRRSFRAALRALAAAAREAGAGDGEGAARAAAAAERVDAAWSATGSQSMGRLLQRAPPAFWATLDEALQDIGNAARQLPALREALGCSGALADALEAVVRRADVPVPREAASGILGLLSEAWRLRDGPRCLALAELLKAVLQGCPELCLAESTQAKLIEVFTCLAATPTAPGPGGRPPRHSAPVPRQSAGGCLSPSTVGLSSKPMRQGDRWSALQHVTAVMRHVHSTCLVRDEEGLLGGLEQADALELVRAARRLCARCPHEVTKPALRLLAALVDRAQSTIKLQVFQTVAADAASRLLPEHLTHWVLPAALRLLQQVLLTAPDAARRHRKAVYTFVVRHVLPIAGAPAPSKGAAEGTFADPPAHCLVLRMGLKALAACIVTCPPEASDAELRQMLPVVADLLLRFDNSPRSVAAAVQAADCVGMLLRLARHRGLRGFFAARVDSGCVVTYSTIAFFSMLQESAAARAEIGRKLLGGLLRQGERLPMSFAAVLCVLICDSNSANYARAVRRVRGAVAWYRKSGGEPKALSSARAPAVCPEYITPHLVHLCARWPRLAELRPSYAPLQRVFYLLFSALLEGDGGAASAHFLANMLHTLRGCTDAAEAETSSMRIVASAASLVLDQVVSEIKVLRGGGAPRGQVPVLLPKDFEQRPEPGPRPTAREHLGKHFRVLRRDRLSSPECHAGAPADQVPPAGGAEGDGDVPASPGAAPRSRPRTLASPASASPASCARTTASSPTPPAKRRRR
eukprot:TRINITY_DN24043_c0_g1_i1.p1 TRINITY_DN24043_c0_g1~~TRINITY_DN24043_c0_g1_i1.p1  ORF type:complete len:1409 (+),score=403.65 TRINITY_DN24043_c0_g1_i1:87-4313(+)